MRKKELTITTTVVPDSVLQNFRRYAMAKGTAGLPQEWLGKFVEYGLMYWHDSDHADYTGLGEELLDDNHRDRGIWEPFVLSNNMPRF